MFYRLSAIALFIIMVSAPPAIAESGSHFVILDQPQPLPELSFKDSKGELLHMSDFRGHPVLLNLWATWCGPCVAEMPSLDRLQAILGNTKLKVIAVDVEHSAADAAPSFFQRHEINNLPIYTDPSGHMSVALGARGLPTTFLIDSEGRVIGTEAGGTDWSSPPIIKFLHEHFLDHAAVAD